MRGVVWVRAAVFVCFAAFSACDDAQPTAATASTASSTGSSTGAKSEPAPRAARKPNVVLISIDTLRADALEPWGATRPTSPHLSALAQESWVFQHAYSQAGVTAPSHMSLLTSLYPTVHGVSNLSVSGKRLAAADAEQAKAIRVDAKVETLATVLTRNGWRSAAFTGGGNVSRELGFDQGFEEFDDSPSNGVDGNDGPWFDETHVAAWIEKHRAEPFFLFVHTWIPHTPYLPPAPWNTEFDPGYQGPIVSSREAFDALPDADDPVLPAKLLRAIDRKNPAEVAHLRALYDGDVRYADESVGKVLAALDAHGLSDETIVVIVSDHGEEFLEHDNFGHPGELWYELVHVPLIVHLPSREARVIAAPARLIDVLPTVLELVDVAPPADVQGRSLVPLVRGTLDEQPIISEIITRWKGSGATRAPANLIRSVRLGNWTYIARGLGGKRIEELYDLSVDPAEKENLAAQRKEHVETLDRFREIVRRHEEACARLSARFGGTDVDVSDETLKEIGRLGYVK
ncbi:MAG: sulfatase-like hydrolase/transferase [Planctomycetes bacterium]|nr:sulfatase-like hydrolase/transferase [Planctomycetota bacterium]